MTTFFTPDTLHEHVDLSDYWYVLCASDALRDRPLACMLRGQRLVAFRAAGRAAVLLDRCPHRHVPLSLGRVQEHTLACAYHGWRFTTEGVCSAVPGRCREGLPNARVPRFACCERDGYLWVWARADAEPQGEPPSLAVPVGYGRVHQVVDYDADLHASIENTIDVPHTHALHRGLLRAASPKRPVQCTLTRRAREVVAEYQGEQRPDTWLARLLVPGDAALQHEDRFLLPSIVRVEYRVGEHTHLLSHACFTPLSATSTRLHASVAFRVGHLPNRLLAPALARVAARVLREDAEILRRQRENVAHFGVGPVVSTELDAFSEQIRRLMHDAAAGELGDHDHAPSRFALML